jgi:hippurate hydrolase
MRRSLARWSSSFPRHKGVIDELHDLHSTLVEWRHDFHRHPELAFEEHRTSSLVQERLESWGVHVTKGIGASSSVVGTLTGTAPRLATGTISSVGLRADMDALPMNEENDVEHKSTVPGKMHGCGHDGHTTMLLGAAKYLAQHRSSFSGTVNFIFQPAEEDGGGGQKMVEGGLFDKFPCDEIYGMHNWPLGLSPGQISVRSGPIMACADDFRIVLRGSGGHAAMPHLTIDPIVMGSSLIMKLQTLVSRTVDPLDPAVVSITGFEGGDGAVNIIPESVTLVGTVRAFEEETRVALKRRLEEMCLTTAQAYGGEYVLEYNDGEW